MNCFEFTVYCSFNKYFISIMLMFLLSSFFLSSYLFQFQEGNSVTSWTYSQNDRNNLLQSYSEYSTLDSDQYYLLSFVNFTDIEKQGPQKDPLYWDWNFYDKLKHEDKYFDGAVAHGFQQVWKEEKDIRSLINDGKVHTLHVIIDDQWSQDLWYLIADWDIVD